MRTLCLLFLGVVVGWAASGVDWSRHAVGEPLQLPPNPPTATIQSSTHGFELNALRDSTPTQQADPAIGVSARGTSPAELIIGRWRDHAEPDDAVIELLEDGTGTITNDSSQETFRVLISWKIGSTYENACLVNVRYEQSKEDAEKPLPPEAKPFKMLAVFDGDDRFVFQRGPNDVTVMDRQSVKKPSEEKRSSIDPAK